MMLKKKAIHGNSEKEKVEKTKAAHDSSLIPRGISRKAKKSTGTKEDASTDESTMEIESKIKKEGQEDSKTQEGSENRQFQKTIVAERQKASANNFINALMIYSGALDLKTPPRKIKFRKEKKQILLRPILK